MTIERRIAGFFNLSDKNWGRHSNPWSVWTRYSVLPVIILAFWSRIWIGWWCLLPGILAILWMFLNPVFFDPPKSTKKLGFKVGFGRKGLPEPRQGENSVTPQNPTD